MRSCPHEIETSKAIEDDAKEAASPAAQGGHGGGGDEAVAPEKRAERSPEDPASVAIAEPEADERRPETTPGIFLEHFDLGEPLDEKTDCIAYKALWLAAKEAARSQGWAFRSYSSLKSRGTRADWIKRNVRSFPMLILFRDGHELGRMVAALSDSRTIVRWAEALLERGFK